MRFDAVVIGSGQAGTPLSQKLAHQGWNVALIEGAHLGGTCINTGCTPTKAMVSCAEVAHRVRNAGQWGVRADNVGVDFPAIVARKNGIVLQFRSGQERSVQKQPRLRLYRGRARFSGPREVVVGEDRLESERFFINTGTRASIPEIEGLKGVSYLTHVGILELQELPRHLIVVGGGYVGLEFGQMFRRFGSDVTIIHESGQILPREDGDVAAELQKALEGEGIVFALNTRTRRARQEGHGIVLEMEGPGGSFELSGTHLLLATGRTPNSDGLGLDAAGVETDGKGFVKVDSRLQTNVPGIWALGDVKGGPAFTHISYNDYQIVFSNLIEGKNLTTENRYVPYSVFTDPELGGVGLTETEARARGFRLKIGKIPMTKVARAIERGETAGLMKIVVDASNDRILGASILASQGGELVQVLGVVMMAGAPYTLLKGAVFIHPTLAEGLWSLMESVVPVN